MVTLSPEKVPCEATRSRNLPRAGVVIAAGHTAADYETLLEARGNGVTGYTHLFNAMRRSEEASAGAGWSGA